MPKQPIPIIGAGIAGLTLSRSLLHRGIPSIIYEKAPQLRGLNYGITLHATAYRPLLKVLDLDEPAFKARVAVDAEEGGLGRLGDHIDVPSHAGLYDTSSSFRANRAKFEALLLEGLDVRVGHSLQGFQSSPEGPRLRFFNGEMWSGGNLVVGADGVHSSLRKLLLASSSRVHVLPYVVFNGRRSILRREFEDVFGGRAMEKQGRNVWETRKGDAVLRVNVDMKTSRRVALSWIYSRAARGDEDPLHRPARPNEHASSVPVEFFHEVRALRLFGYPFSVMFDTVKMRGDKILHWLMRITSAPLPELQDLLAKSGVCLIGDAAHAEPILGGNGANAAIIDALELADTIWRGGEDTVASWYNDRYPKWVQGAEESQTSIARIHEPLTREDANL